MTSRAVVNLSDEEERLMPMLNNLSRQYLGPEYGAHKASAERVTMDQVDSVSALNCMSVDCQSSTNTVPNAGKQV